ncbi:MAG: crossover junction endodeoxyribonuclease RuvC [Bacteriovoracaceae bacterium]|nr:crossover junction endodeoxyribonuclease RuvC [Bacteriovoracaceae bacterium]
MIILGIDPGSRTTGYGLLQFEKREIKYLTSGVLIFEQEKNFLLRLPQMREQMDVLVKTYNPHVAVFESLIYVKGTTSILKLAQTRGAMIASLPKEIEVVEYSPNLVKSATVGHGHADKESIQKFLKMVLGKSLPENFKTNDESDALAIAFCHILQKGNGSLGAKKSGSLAQAVSHKVKEL